MENSRSMPVGETLPSGQTKRFLANDAGKLQFLYPEQSDEFQG